MKLQDYRPDKDGFGERRILITGASDGIGRATARLLAGVGAHLILLGRQKKKLQEAARSCEKAGAASVCSKVMDFATAGEAEYVETGELVLDHHPHLDGLLNNAGFLAEHTPVAQSDARRWHDTMQVNLNACFLMTRELLPMLEKAPGAASILFTSSLAARQGFAYISAYCASKFALEGLMQALAMELEKTGNIHVCSLDPGIISTTLRHRVYPDEPVDAFPGPETVAPAFAYLLGPEGARHHGQSLRYDDKISKRGSRSR